MLPSRTSGSVLASRGSRGSRGPLDTLGSVLPALARSSPAPAQKKKTRLIVVFGYTCDRYPTNMANRINSLRAIAGNAGKVAHVDVFCNEQDPHSMTRNIVRRLVAPKKALPDTPFVQKVRAAVCAALRRGERVLLAGHSYGGSVATRIAESVDCSEGGGTLEVATFGSIYVRSPRAIQPGVRIRHYMYEKNIAAACHRRNVATCSFVNAIPTSLNGVRAHMDYQAFVDEIARTGAIDVDIAAVLAKKKKKIVLLPKLHNRRGKKSGFRLPGKGRVQQLLDRGIVNIQGGLYGR